MDVNFRWGSAKCSACKNAGTLSWLGAGRAKYRTCRACWLRGCWTQTAKYCPCRVRLLVAWLLAADRAKYCPCRVRWLRGQS
eukprot:4290607-Amphidinium_carterae.2